MTPSEIIDACDHKACRATLSSGCCGSCDGVCQDCAERAIAAAVEAERTRIEAVILRNVDADWKHALIEDIRARGGSNG